MGSNSDRAEGKKDIAKLSPSADSAGIRSAALEGWTHPEQIKQTVRDSEKVLKAAVSAISDSVPVVGLAAADQITKDLHGLSKGIADFVDQCKSNPLHVPEALSKLVIDLGQHHVLNSISSTFEIPHAIKSMNDYLANPNEKTASSACDHLAKCMQLKDFEKAHLAVFMAPTAENINKLALAMAKEYHFPIKGAQALESYLKDPKNELKKSEFTKIVSEELGPHTGQQIEALTVMIATSVAGKVGAAALGEAGVAGEAAVASSSVNVAGVESSAGHAAGELASLTPKTVSAESLTVAQMEERLARLPSHTNYETQLKVPDRTTQIHVQNLEGSIPLEIDQAAKQATEILSEHKTVGQWLKEMASGQHSTLLPDGDHPHTSNLLNAYAEHLKHIPLRCRFSGIGAGGESLTFSPSLQIKNLQIHPETKVASLKPGANFQAADKHKSWDMINNKAIAKNPLHTDEKLHDSVLKITKPALREEFGSMDHLSGTRDWEGTRTSPLWSKTIDVAGSKKSIKSYIYFQEKLTPTRPSQEQLDAIREAISKSNRVIWDKDSIDGGQFGKNKSGQLKLMDLTATIDENSEYWNQFHK